MLWLPAAVEHQMCAITLLTHSTTCYSSFVIIFRGYLRTLNFPNLSTYVWQAMTYKRHIICIRRATISLIPPENSNWFDTTTLKCWNWLSRAQHGKSMTYQNSDIKLLWFIVEYCDSFAPILQLSSKWLSHKFSAPFVRAFLLFIFW